MTELSIRRATPDDLEVIIALSDAAFEGPDEGLIVRRLREGGDSLVSFVAEHDGTLVGHIEFFRILIDDAPLAAGLGPMSVKPGYQKRGIGGELIGRGLAALDALGESVIFVLGHAAYYPNFGFTEAAAQPFKARWSGPHFMALRLRSSAPNSGTLTYPPAFD